MMTTDNLLHPLVIAAVLSASAIIKFSKNEFENGLSRGFAALWFFYVHFNPEITVETVRVMGRWVLTQIPAVEIAYFMAVKYFSWKYGKAIKNLHIEGCSITHEYHK